MEEKIDVQNKKGRIARFLAKKDVEISARRYAINALGAMALGLFGSLLIATIFNAIGMIPALAFFKTIGGYGAKAAGPAMAVAIAFALKAPPLVMYSTALVGLMANEMGGAGGPLAVFFIVLIATEIGKLVSKETKVDILVTPFVTVLVGGLLAMLVAPQIGTLVGYIGNFISWATLQVPVVMGLVISVVVGMALTLPISSAAICAGIGLSAIGTGDLGLALAGGAAVAGCCAQMVGFAVMSFRENGWGGLVSQGIGTSMLQMPNIVRNPRIWIPPIVASAVTGPLATCVFGLKMYGAAINSGMGTCGFLGPIGVVIGWFGEEYVNPAYGNAAIGAMDWVGLALICFVLPALISWGLGLVLRKIGWIKENDLKLQ